MKIFNAQEISSTRHSLQNATLLHRTQNTEQHTHTLPSTIKRSQNLTYFCATLVVIEGTANCTQKSYSRQNAICSFEIEMIPSSSTCSNTSFGSGEALQNIIIDSTISIEKWIITKHY